MAVEVGGVTVKCAHGYEIPADYCEICRPPPRTYADQPDAVSAAQVGLPSQEIALRHPVMKWIEYEKRGPYAVYKVKLDVPHWPLWLLQGRFATFAEALVLYKTLRGMKDLVNEDRQDLDDIGRATTGLTPEEMEQL